MTLCSRSAYPRESSSATPTKTENLRPETVSAFWTARLIHSRWLGVNESPAGTRATHVLAGIVALGTASPAGACSASASGSLVACFGTRVRGGGLQLSRLTVTHPERIVGVDVVATCSVNGVAILLMAITMKKNKSGKPTRSRRTWQRRGISDLWPPRERFQRH